MSQLRQLATPFDARLIEQVQGNDYVNHASVTERALATVGPYSISKVEPIAEASGVISGALVTIEFELDGRYVTITEAGECSNPTSKTNGAKLKDAISDGVKRCWMRTGLGLHLWSQKHYVLDKVLERNEKPRQESVTDDGPPPLTDADVARSEEAAAAHAELQHPESLAERDKPHEPRKLHSHEASRLHAALGAIGYPQDKHLPLAKFRFKRDFTSFTELTIQESVELKGYAERQMEKRKAAA